MDCPSHGQVGEIVERRYKEPGAGNPAVHSRAVCSRRRRSAPVTSRTCTGSMRRSAGSARRGSGSTGCVTAVSRVADTELPPGLLTRRLENSSRGTAVTQGHAADRTAEQLQDPAQRAADRIDALRRIPERSESARSARDVRIRPGAIAPGSRCSAPPPSRAPT